MLVPSDLLGVLWLFFVVFTWFGGSFRFSAKQSTTGSPYWDDGFRDRVVVDHLISLGISPQKRGFSLFRKPFLLYHRSGFHFPQPWFQVTRLFPANRPGHLELFFVAFSWFGGFFHVKRKKLKSFSRGSEDGVR